MKKMFLGSLMFVSGFIGILVLMCISIFKPWEYNGIGGFEGFLLGTDTKSFFHLYCVLFIVGISICIYGAFFKNSVSVNKQTYLLKRRLK